MMTWIQSKGRITVDPKSLFIAPLLKIWNDDETPTKDQANALLAYIHLVSQLDPEAPYFTASALEIRALVKKQLFGDPDFVFDEPLNDLLEYAIIEYQRAYEDASHRAVRIYRQKIDEIITEIGQKKPQIVQTQGIKGQIIFVSNVDFINKAMKELPNLIAVMEGLEEKVKRMSKNDIQIRGGKRQSILTKRQTEYESKTEKETTSRVGE
jgi:hypothetical protein